ncbi:ParA family protein [Hyphomicrobium sp.]|jgi:chromosome partitioning protein|uniref:ParA family protein n=1 Tax=Hyphomicrobium sp. TaxID=82 RepID=UPI003566BA95
MPVVLSIIGQKGGVGKSTLARAVAVVATQGNLRVKLIDLDIGQQTSVRWSTTRASSRALKTIDAEAFSAVGEALKQVHDVDLIVVDTPGYLSPETFEVARASDLIILPTGSGTDDLHPTTLLLYELEHIGIPKDRLCVALCRVLDAKEERGARRYLESTGYPALNGSLPERLGYRRAHNGGKSVTETTESSLNERANELMASVLRKILQHVRAANRLHSAH